MSLKPGCLYRTNWDWVISSYPYRDEFMTRHMGPKELFLAVGGPRHVVISGLSVVFAPRSGQLLLVSDDWFQEILG